MSNITKRFMKAMLLAAALIITVSATAQAQPFRHGGFGVRVGPRIGFGFGGFYDPFWGPYYPYGAYPYPYVVHPSAQLRVSTQRDPDLRGWVPCRNGRHHRHHAWWTRDYFVSARV